jgi:hypothetical protein
LPDHSIFLGQRLAAVERVEDKSSHRSNYSVHMS